MAVAAYAVIHVVILEAATEIERLPGAVLLVSKPVAAALIPKTPAVVRGIRGEGPKTG